LLSFLLSGIFSRSAVIAHLRARIAGKRKECERNYKQRRWLHGENPPLGILHKTGTGPSRAQTADLLQKEQF
jgi:hypothetical protein